MGVINVLSTEVSNQIAAGEVVERPASVVKELVENSIDAGATAITVEIKNGGNTYIRVADNGCGMELEDARIAFLRHATSKIHTAKDLEAIHTLGFRGEALSSIGAVAQIDLFTKRRGDEMGAHVICSGGDIVNCEEAGTADGTTLIVRNLFFNMPARMKFLKKDATEAAHIADIMTRFILARPEISFRFMNNGKEQLFSAGDNKLENCIYAVYGKQYAKAALAVAYEDGGVRVSGVVGKGEAARPNRTYQSFFVNKRYIKSPMMVRALEEAFKNRIMIGKFPVAALNIEVDPAQIDINVHPTKLEVKFSDDSMIYRAVYHAVKNTLFADASRPAVERPEPPFTADTAKVKGQVELELPKNWRDPLPEAVEERMTTTAKPKRQPDLGTYNLEHSAEYFQRKQEQAAQIDRYMEQMRARLEQTAPPVQQEPAPVPEPEVVPAPQKDMPVRVIGQVFDTYVLAERGEELLIIDQHAAHERLKFEELKAELAKREIHPQMLLTPVIVELSAVEYALYCENAGLFAEMGFEMEEFGDRSVIIRATPKAVDEDELRQLVVELLTNIGENKRDVITARDERLLYTIACKAAIKANHPMNMRELEALAEAVLSLENINTCPHGRPIVITMSEKELEKEFGRII